MPKKKLTPIRPGLHNIPTFLISFCMLFIFIIGPASSIAGVLYKWTDHKGQTHITDYPPSEKDATSTEKIEVEERPEEPFADDGSSNNDVPVQDLQNILSDLLNYLREGSDSVELPSEFKTLQDLDPEALMDMSDGEFPVELSGPMIDLMGTVGTLMAIIFFAISLLINLYLMLCTYLIARKTGVSYAWMSWVPILNIFPIFGAAGYSWWVGPAVLFLPLFLMIPVILIPPVGAVLSFIVAIGLIIFLVNAWMKICESLNVTKLAGLLIIVPVFNLLLLSYLALKKEPHLERLRRLRPAVIASIVFIAIVAIYSIVTPLYIMPQFRTFLSVQASSKQGYVFMPNEGTTDRPEASGTRSGIDVLSLTRNQYEEILRKGAINPEPGMGLSLGPIAINMDTFWDDERSPHFWLRIRSIDIPNLYIGNNKSSGRMDIDSVLDGYGKDIYDGDSPFETEAFSGLTFQKRSVPIEHYQAIRDIRVLPGSSEGNIHTISGKLTIMLPLNIRSITLTSTDIGELKKKHGEGLETGLSGDNEIIINYNGDLNNYIATIAFDRNDSPLEWISSSVTDSINGGYLIKETYRGKVSSAQLITASGYMKKTYGFKLSK